MTAHRERLLPTEMQITSGKNPSKKQSYQTRTPILDDSSVLADWKFLK